MPVSRNARKRKLNLQPAYLETLESRTMLSAAIPTSDCDGGQQNNCGGGLNPLRVVSKTVNTALCVTAKVVDAVLPCDNNPCAPPPCDPPTPPCNPNPCDPGCDPSPCGLGVLAVPVRVLEEVVSTLLHPCAPNCQPNPCQPDPCDNGHSDDCGHNDDCEPNPCGGGIKQGVTKIVKSAVCTVVNVAQAVVNIVTPCRPQCPPPEPCSDVAAATKQTTKATASKTSKSTSAQTKNTKASKQQEKKLSPKKTTTQVSKTTQKAAKTATSSARLRK